MTIFDFFNKYHFRNMVWYCANCIYFKNSKPFAPYLESNKKYCDHPELKEQTIDEKLVHDFGYCDAFQMRFY